MEQKTSYLLMLGACLVALFSILIVTIIFAEPLLYSALYFEDSSELPFAIELEESSSFTFVIENHEGGVEDYSYYVLLYLDGELYNVLKDGSIELDDGSMAYVTSSFVVSEDFESAQVVVIVNSQEIYFYIVSQE